MSPVFLPILVSAAVSLVVTLGIEYFAKPGLEARKIIILEELAARRKALRTCRAILFAFGKLDGPLRAEAKKSISTLTERLEEELLEVIVNLPVEHAHFAGRAVGFLKAVCLTGRYEAAKEPIAILAHLLETATWWTVLGRRVAARNAAAWLAKQKPAPALEEPADAPPALPPKD